MGIIRRLEAGAPVSARRRLRAQTGYAAAEFSRLTASLIAQSEYINTTLRYQLRVLRARSRQASQNNPYAKRFAQLCVDNIAGPTPFRLQAKTKFKNGKFDRTTNNKIENAWRLWGRKGECEVTGLWSWNTLQRQIARTLPVDGEVLMRKLKGGASRFGYQLQMIDVDRLDEQKNEKLSDGRVINMGVEMNEQGRPLAYHLLKRKPSTWDRGYVREYERVPAEEIIHLFVPDFAEQARGVPWIYAALLNLIHLGAFEEAAVIAARIGAAKMGFYQTPEGEADPLADRKDAKTGEFFEEVEPGVFGTVPEGYEFVGWDPKYPDAAVDPFCKHVLRGCSAAVGVAHHNLSNNLEGVNYTSSRTGELHERDMWLGLQQFVVEHLHEPLYDDWLPTQVVLGNLALPMGANGQMSLDKYRDVRWQGKRWQWVDPLKEVNAKIAAIDSKLTSRTRVIAESGDDVEDVATEIAEENTLFEDLGVSLAPPAPAGNGNGNGNDDEETPDGEPEKE